jgi:Na+/H+ antiporter NhaD/arsenite permease-like protein
VILLLIGISSAFGYLISLYGVADLTGKMLSSVTTQPWLIFLLVNVFLFVLGTFLDMAATILLCTPIFLPICQHYGMSSAHRRAADRHLRAGVLALAAFGGAGHMTMARMDAPSHLDTSLTRRQRRPRRRRLE